LLNERKWVYGIAAGRLDRDQPAICYWPTRKAMAAPVLCGPGAFMALIEWVMAFGVSVTGFSLSIKSETYPK
jgi:hypothetical protein